MKDSTTTTQTPTAPIPKNAEQEATALYRYKEGVEELWKLKSSKPISNGEHAHAAILFASFFEHAEKQVRIFCTNLAKDVFGRLEVVRAAQSALNRGVVIDIILQENPEESEFKNFLDSKKIQFVKGDDRVSNFEMNFAVMDDTAIRYEPDRSKCEATAVMYDPKSAKTLSVYFDKLWAMLKTPTPQVA